MLVTHICITHIITTYFLFYSSNRNNFKDILRLESKLIHSSSVKLIQTFNHLAMVKTSVCIVIHHPLE